MAHSTSGPPPNARTAPSLARPRPVTYRSPRGSRGHAAQHRSAGQGTELRTPPQSRLPHPHAPDSQGRGGVTASASSDTRRTAARSSRTQQTRTATPKHAHGTGRRTTGTRSSQHPPQQQAPLSLHHGESEARSNHRACRWMIRPRYPAALTAGVRRPSRGEGGRDNAAPPGSQHRARPRGDPLRGVGGDHHRGQHAPEQASGIEGGRKTTARHYCWRRAASQVNAASRCSRTSSGISMSPSSKIPNSKQIATA